MQHHVELHDHAMAGTAQRRRARVILSARLHLSDTCVDPDSQLIIQLLQSPCPAVIDCFVVESAKTDVGCAVCGRAEALAVWCGVLRERAARARQVDALCKHDSSRMVCHRLPSIG